MKKTLVLILTILLLVSCLSPIVAGSANLSFVAVNDTIPLTLSASEQSYYSGGILYVPHTAFSANGLECYLSYSGDNTLSLYNRNKRLDFDLSARSAIDENGNIYPISTTMKNGIVFLPAQFCAGHFGMSVSLLSSSGGYVITRFTNGNQIYDNSLFVQRAENFIAYKVAEAEPTTTTSPTVSGDASAQTEAETEPEPEIIPATIYLGIIGGDNLSQNMSTLEQSNQIATFFLTEQEILENGNLLRQLAAQGHYLGIYGNSLAEIQEANQAYLSISLPKSLLVVTEFGVDTADFQDGYQVYALDEEPEEARELASHYDTVDRFFANGNQLVATMVAFTAEKAQVNPLRETNIFQ